MKNDVDSTEKLLELIRGKRKGVQYDYKKGVHPVLSDVASYLKIGHLFKSTVVGVDFGHNSLRLVRLTDSLAMLDSKVVPIRYGIDIGTSEFVNFLKAELDSFCGSIKNKKIWFLMSAANVDVYFIRIPKVPDNQIEQVVYTMAKREVAFNEKEFIFDYEISGEVVEQGKAKLSVMFYTARRKEVDAISSTFRRTGYPLYGITIAPFAIQNFFKTQWYATEGQSIVANIFVGNGYSRIDIFRDSRLVLTRDIKTGVSSIVELLAEHLGSGMAEDEHTVTDEVMRNILSNIDSDIGDFSKSKAGIAIEQEELKEVVGPAVGRLAMQIERTFEHFTALLENKRIDLIYFSSVLHIEKYLTEELTKQIGIKCEIFDPLANIIGNKGFKERDYLLPVVAVALSNIDYTPNILQVKKDKNIEAKQNFVEKVVFTFFIAIMLCSVVFYGKQQHDIKKKQGILGGITQQLQQADHNFDKQSIIGMIDDVKRDKQKYSDYIKRYMGVAVINEISSLVPKGAYLTSCKINIGSSADNATGSKLGEGSLMVDGMITGSSEAYDSVLANFMARISNSPMFSTVSVKKTSAESMEKVPFQKFLIEVGLAKHLK
ncbi:MAG: PilN domain-containing protein [Nitrospirae bacterium]|nr:PilN domain-containing protein [Nitrospirota bacterium]